MCVLVLCVYIIHVCMTIVHTLYLLRSVMSLAFTCSSRKHALQCMLYSLGIMHNASRNVTSVNQPAAQY